MKKYTPLSIDTICHPELDSGSPSLKDKKSFVAPNLKTRQRRGVAGFTLIELLVVIVIIGILAVISIPRFVEYVDNAKYAKQIAEARQDKSSFLADLYGSGGSLSTELITNPELADNDSNGFPDHFVAYYYPSTHPWTYNYTVDGNFVFTSTKHITGLAGGNFPETKYLIEMRYRRLTAAYAPLKSTYPQWREITNSADFVDRWYTRYVTVDTTLNGTDRYFYFGRFDDGDQVTYEIDWISMKKINR
jgi:prepilin-type N-terminal cleavage/methylation domain-containing protein